MIVEPERCATLRERVREASAATVAAETDLPAVVVDYHVRGYCGHDLAVAPADSDRIENLPESQCTRMREALSNGASARDVAEEVGTDWATTVAHLTGDCEHHGGPTFDRESAYEGLLVSAEECGRLRRAYDGQAVTSMAADLPWGYATVLRHLNGQCDHDIDADPRETRGRTYVSPELCRQLRETYREDADYTVQTLADQYEVTASTAETHIKFRCSHDPPEWLRELMRAAGLESYVDAEVGSDVSESGAVSPEAAEESGSGTASASTSATGARSVDASPSGGASDPGSGSASAASASDRGPTGETRAAPTAVEADSLPTPRLRIIGDLERVDRERATRRLRDLGWRVGTSPEPEDRFVVVGDGFADGGGNDAGDDTTGGDGEAVGDRTPRIDEATFLEYFGFDDDDRPDAATREADGREGRSPTADSTPTPETDRDPGSAPDPDPAPESGQGAGSSSDVDADPSGESNSNSNSDSDSTVGNGTVDGRAGSPGKDRPERSARADDRHREDVETYGVSPQARAAVRRAVADPDVDAADEPELLASVLRSHLKETVDDPTPTVTDRPESPTTVAVDVDDRNRTLIESLCGTGVYEAPSAFVEDAIRSQLDVPDATARDVTIPADAVARIAAATDSNSDSDPDEGTVEEFVVRAVERALDEGLDR